MVSANEWKTREENLKNLELQRAELDGRIKELAERIKDMEAQKKKLSKQIHLEQVKINQHKRKTEEHKINTNTEVYKMFGKPLKDLTKEEYKKYYNTRQKINRQRRKEATEEERKAS
jgi:hypothetical protein